MKKILLGILLGGLILGLGSCALVLFTADKAVESVDNAIKETEKESANKDELLKGMLEKAPQPLETKDDWSYTVKYTLTNDSGEDFDYIQLNADVFDDKGTKLGNNMTNITEIKAGQTFELTLDLYQEGASSYKITSISSEPK